MDVALMVFFICRMCVATDRFRVSSSLSMHEQLVAEKSFLMTNFSCTTDRETHISQAHPFKM